MKKVNKFNLKPNKLWVDQGLQKTYGTMGTHNEGNSAIVEMFIKTLKAKIYKKMTANDIKFYLTYLNKLWDQYNNSHYYSINKKPNNADYSALTGKFETNPKADKFKVN